MGRGAIWRGVICGDLGAGVLDWDDGSFECLEEAGVAGGEEEAEFFAAADGVAEAAECAVKPVGGLDSVAEELCAFAGVANLATDRYDGWASVVASLLEVYNRVRSK